MTELNNQEFLQEFKRDAEFADNEVRSWPAYLRAQAAKTGILEFPRSGNVPKVDDRRSFD